jgi:cobalt/nickel transport system ATP-binding protein
MSHPDVEVDGLDYVYPDGTQALRDVSFRIGTGRAVALIGGNGAGKSTLLLHLCGALLPTRGVVRLAGMPITRGTVARARQMAGLVFQDPDDQLFMPTVAEDVAFGPMNAGLPPEAVERRVTAALDRVGLAHLRERPPYRLSAGEKRGAAIATVLAMAPAVLVMDEPSTHLDPRGRRRLIELLRALPQTRIIATHDLDLVLETCDEALLLSDGRRVAHGPAATLLADEPLMLAHGLESRPARQGPFPAPGKIGYDSCC